MVVIYIHLTLHSKIVSDRIMHAKIIPGESVPNHIISYLLLLLLYRGGRLGINCMAAMWLIDNDIVLYRNTIFNKKFFFLTIFILVRLPVFQVL